MDEERFESGVDGETPPDTPIEMILLGGVQELFQRVFFLEGVLAEVITVLSEDMARQPSHAADRLREMLEEIEQEATEPEEV